MKNKDLSFGAGGINLLERLFQSLPSVVICSANNQKEGLKELKDRKIIYFLGYKNKTSKSTIINCCNNISLIQMAWSSQLDLLIKIE